MARPSTGEEDVIGTVALVIALPEERDYFHQVVSKRPGWAVPSARQHYKCFYQYSDEKRVRVAVRTLQGMGLVEAVLGANSIIASATPEIAMIIGIAGSLAPDLVGLGDVVVSNQAKFYASDKVGDINELAGGSTPKYVTRSDVDADEKRRQGALLLDDRDRFLTSSFLRYQRNFAHSDAMDGVLSDIEPTLGKRPLQQLDGSALKKEIMDLKSSQRGRRIHNGWLLGSANVVDSKEYRDYLNAKNEDLSCDLHRQGGEPDRARWAEGQLLAVDMESYGLLRAVEIARSAPSYEGGCDNLIGGVAVRGISDLCEGKGLLDSATGKQIRRLAAENATEVGLSLIESLDWTTLTS